MIFKNLLQFIAALLLWAIPGGLIVALITTWPLFTGLVGGILYALAFDLIKFKNWLFKH